MMFQTWELEADPSRARRLAAAAFGALATLAGLFALAVLLPHESLRTTTEPAVVVAFRPPPEIKTAVVVVPPPPKVLNPRVATPIAVAPTLAPPVPQPAAAPMVAPKALPTERPAESDKAVAAVTVAVGGTGDGRGSAVGSDEAESAAPVVATAGSTGPINLPEDAEPAEPSDDNPMPEYPEAARTTGLEAVVILKIVIGSDGHVGKIQVLKGDEPFLTSALTAVRSWTYAPARLDGHAISIFKIIKLPFRLRTE